MPTLSLVTWSSAAIFYLLSTLPSTSLIILFFSCIPNFYTNLYLPISTAFPLSLARLPMFCLLLLPPFHFSVCTFLFWPCICLFLYRLLLSSSSWRLPLVSTSLLSSFPSTITLSLSTHLIGLHRLFTLLQLNFTIVLSCVQQKSNPCLCECYLCIGVCDMIAHLC